MLNGYSAENIGKKVIHDFPVLMTAELAFWPFFNFINFKYVPVNFQSTIIYVGTVFWATILSSIEESASNAEQSRESMLLPTASPAVDE